MKSYFRFRFFFLHCEMKDFQLFSRARTVVVLVANEVNVCVITILILRNAVLHDFPMTFTVTKIHKSFTDN